jgi:hypothetical protein
MKIVTGIRSNHTWNRLQRLAVPLAHWPRNVAMSSSARGRSPLPSPKRIWHDGGMVRSPLVADTAGRTACTAQQARRHQLRVFGPLGAVPGQESTESIIWSDRTCLRWAGGGEARDSGD